LHVLSTIFVIKMMYFLFCDIFYETIRPDKVQTGVCTPGVRTLAEYILRSTFRSTVIEVVIIIIMRFRLDIKVNNSASESWVIRPTLPRKWQLNNLRDNLSVRLSLIFLSNNL
jgi:hypothetical protein